MLRIIGTRGSGKTTQLLRYAAENNAIFVCSYPPYAKELAKKLNISNYENMEFISYRDFHNFNYDKSRFIVIDELNGLINYEYGAKIIGYTEGQNWND